MHETSPSKPLHVIALFEASKGLAALGVLVGVVDLLHHNAQRLAVELIGPFGRRPTARVSSVLLHYVKAIPIFDVGAVIGLGVANVALRLCETYGLWQQRAWGEYLPVVSGELDIPFELTHVVRHTTAIGIAVLAFNVWLVGYRVLKLKQRLSTPSTSASGLASSDTARKAYFLRRTVAPTSAVIVDPHASKQRN